MAYQALYRQWRPADFSHMVGQEAIIESLRHQVQTGHISHAYLFCGSRGTGKTSTAKILARAINCEHPLNGDPCGTCETCIRMQAREYLDILEFDAASNSRVEDARELLEKANFPPQYGKYKVYIIDEVHMLSNSAFNALLKTLEEPPEYLVFILATTEPYRLPATILSRCQRFDFGRIPAAKIRQRLREAVEGAGGKATDGSLMMIARAAEGSMRDALSILDMCIGYERKIDETLVRQVLGTKDRTFLFRFCRALSEENAAETIRMIDELINGGNDPLIFSRNVSEHLRTMILARCCDHLTADEVTGLTEEDAKEFMTESRDIPVSRLMDMLDLFMQLETDLRYSASPRIALENTALKCCLRTKQTDMLSVSEQLERLEKKIAMLENKLAGVQIRMIADDNKHEDGQKPQEPPLSLKHADKKEPVSKVMKHAQENPDGIWKAALELLKISEPGIHGMFRMGDFLGADGNEFRWKAKPSFDVIAQSLNSPDRKKRIEKALGEASGTACTFRALESREEAAQNEDTSDEKYLETLYNTFGQEPVDVIDQLKDG